MIVFVDYEHPEGRASEWGQKILAARTWITYRLEDLAAMPCMLVRYDRVTPDLLATIGARAIFISGNGTDPSRYEPSSLEPLQSIIIGGGLPVFGFCGGFQCIASALGTSLSPIKTEGISSERLAPFGDGRLGELGYHSVDLITDHPLLDGVEAKPIVRHAHYLEVRSMPTGFERLASSEFTEVQMAVNDDRRIVGTQFHPEYYTDEHPAGRAMISNFMRWAEITA